MASLLPLIAPLPQERRRRDRRAGPRVQVELECEQREPGARYFRITWDLSVFGVSIRGAGVMPPLGTRMDLRLHLPDDRSRPIGLRAEVVGFHRDSDGVRLAFRNAPVESIRRISRFLTGRRR